MRVIVNSKVVPKVTPPNTIYIVLGAETSVTNANGLEHGPRNMLEAI